MAACAEKNALWGKNLEASGRKLSDALPSPDFAVASETYGYETAMGRASWPSRDPIGEWGGLNIYDLVDNNPVNLIDKLGLKPYTFPDGTTAEFDDLPPELQSAINDYEREKQELENLRKKKEYYENRLKGLKDGTIEPVKILGPATVEPVFDSEMQKCMYYCMDSMGAIEAAEVGISLSLASIPFATVPKLGRKGLGNAKPYTTPSSYVQSAVNQIRKKSGLRPQQFIRQLGDRASKAGDAVRYAGIALNLYALGVATDCYCECKKKLSGNAGK